MGLGLIQKNNAELDILCKTWECFTKTHSKIIFSSSTYKEVKDKIEGRQEECRQNIQSELIKLRARNFQIGDHLVVVNKKSLRFNAIGELKAIDKEADSPYELKFTGYPHTLFYRSIDLAFQKTK